MAKIGEKQRPLDGIMAKRNKELGLDSNSEVSNLDEVACVNVMIDPASVLIPVELIDTPDQPRDNFGDPEITEHILSLAKDITQNTQLDSIIVHINPSDSNRFVLEAGECRLRAVRDVLCLPHIRSTIVEYSSGANDLDYKLRQLSSNEHRIDFKPIQRAKAWLALTNEFGLSINDLSDKLNVSRHIVGKYLSLLDAPRDVQDLIEKGILAPSKWWNDKSTVLKSISSFPYNEGGIKKPSVKNTTPDSKSSTPKKGPFIKVPYALVVDVLSIYSGLCTSNNLDVDLDGLSDDKETLDLLNDDAETLLISLAVNTKLMKGIL